MHSFCTITFTFTLRQPVELLKLVRNSRHSLYGGAAVVASIQMNFFLLLFSSSISIRFLFQFSCSYSMCSRFVCVRDASCLMYHCIEQNKFHQVVIYIYVFRRFASAFLCSNNLFGAIIIIIIAMIIIIIENDFLKM